MTDRLAELIAEFLEGALDPAGRAELNARLRDDAAARSRFAAAMRQETLVGEVLRDARAAAEARPVTRRRSSRRRRAAGRPPAYFPWVAAAAAGLLASLAVLFASRPTPPPAERVVRNVEEPPAEPPAEPPPPPARAAPAPRPVETPPPAAPSEPPAPLPPAAAPVPAGQPAPPAAEAPAPPPRPAATPTTVAASVATIQTVERQVFALTPAGRVAARAGDAIAPGHGLETADGRAVVAFPDGTRVDLGPATRVRAFADRQGKEIDLRRGALDADVARQAAGRPMVVTTPHGEARVLGTQLRLVVDGDRTRLEVREGKVRLTRADGKFAEVAAGAFAVAAAGVELRPRALPSDPSLIGHWKLDEGRGALLLDSSWGANDGTVTGATWAPGRHGAALRFDGSDGQAVIAGRFPFPRNALTVAAWVRHESLPGKVQRYVVVRSDVDLAVLRHDGADRPRQLDFFVNAGGFRHLRANDALVTGAWTHVAATWDGQVQRLFLNGTEAARQDTAGALAAKEAGVVWLGVPREPMHGLIDDVRLYNRALSDKEIAELARR
jgi:ferric-dicitrate binding protein FerR (iron transport regulator)